jgi:hypothetical protein
MKIADFNNVRLTAGIPIIHPIEIGWKTRTLAAMLPGPFE